MDAEEKLAFLFRIEDGGWGVGPTPGSRVPAREEEISLEIVDSVGDVAAACTFASDSVVAARIRPPSWPAIDD